MNAMVLGFGGSGLLISSFVALILLLRMGCMKHILKSPLHILSTSDTLISIITSIILLVNQSTSTTNFDQTFPIISDGEVENRQLILDHGENEYFQNQSCMRFYHTMNDSRLDSSECTFQNVLLHYAMFLIPFANAFVSLLIYSVQCSSGMSCFNKKCSSSTRLSRLGVEVLNVNLQGGNSEAQGDQNIISEDPKVPKNMVDVNSAISNNESVLTNLNSDHKFIGVGLITQWLVPLFVTAILYVSKTQDMNELHKLSEMECIFKVNFPLESCYSSELIILRNSEKNSSQFTLEVEIPDSSRISYPDSETIDEVVLRVRKVVQSAMNKTCGNNASESNYYDSLKPWNITKYITMNNSTQQLASTEDEMLETLNNIQKLFDDKDLQIFGIKKCETSEDEESKLFEDLVERTRSKNSTETMTTMGETRSEDLGTSTPITISSYINKADKILENNVGEISVDKMSYANKTVISKTVENITGKLNDKIYTDIIKRIRDTVMQVEVKGQTGNRWEKKDGDNYKANKENLRNYVDETSIGSEYKKFRDARNSRRNISNDYKDKRNIPAQFATNTECFLSTRFLKIHLLILLFLIYFIPVLISGILQTRALYMCKNILEQIETAEGQQDSETSQIPNQTVTTIDENLPSKSGWFSAKSIDSPNVRQIDKQIEQQEAGFENVLHETKNLQTLFNLLTKSLTLGIIMWTPAFLEILSKVFLCASTPSWLVNILYLLGISFGIVKNFFNVSMAKINKNINDQAYRKENSVHPDV